MALRGQRLGRRARHHGAVGDRRTAAVARAVDRAAVDVDDGAALVGADRGERLERARRRLGDHQLGVGDTIAAADRDVGGGGERCRRRRASAAPGCAGGGGRGRGLGGGRRRRSRVSDGGAGAAGADEDGAAGRVWSWQVISPGMSEVQAGGGEEPQRRR